MECETTSVIFIGGIIGFFLCYTINKIEEYVERNEEIKRLTEEKKKLENRKREKVEIFEMTNKTREEAREYLLEEVKKINRKLNRVGRELKDILE